MTHSITETLKHNSHAYILPMIDTFHGMKSGRNLYSKPTLEQLLVNLNKAAHQFLVEIRSELRLLTLTGLDHNLQHLYVDLHNVNVVICDIQIFMNQHNRRQQQQQQALCTSQCVQGCIIL